MNNNWFFGILAVIMGIVLFITKKYVIKNTTNPTEIKFKSTVFNGLIVYSFVLGVWYLFLKGYEIVTDLTVTQLMPIFPFFWLALAYGIIRNKKNK